MCQDNIIVYMSNQRGHYLIVDAILNCLDNPNCVGWEEFKGDRSLLERYSTDYESLTLDDIEIIRWLEEIYLSTVSYRIDDIVYLPVIGECGDLLLVPEECLDEWDEL